MHSNFSVAAFGLLDATTLHQKDDASHGDKIDFGGADSMELQKDGHGCGARRGEEFRWKCSNENFEEAVEGSSSNSKDLDELILGTERKRKTPSSRMKHEFIETNEPGTEDSWSQSKCCGILLQSSPVGSTAKENGGGDVRRENDVEGDRINACGSDREEFGTTELVESSSEDRALASDLYPESGAISVRPSNKQIFILESSTADALSSYPSMTEKKNLERCTMCSKPQRYAFIFLPSPFIILTLDSPYFQGSIFFLFGCSLDCLYRPKQIFH